jgi:hypothetical protein
LVKYITASTQKGGGMKPQNFQLRDREVIERFIDFRKKNDKVQRKLNLSWSNWGFGIEPLEQSWYLSR